VDRRASEEPGRHPRSVVGRERRPRLPALVNCPAWPDAVAPEG
jgi:hypothetical protein